MNESYCERVQYRGRIRNHGVKDRRWVWKWGLGVMVVVFLFSYALAYVWVRIKITNLRYAYTNLQAEEIKMVNEEKKLTIEWATLTSLNQIEQIAKERLGMIVPKKEHVSLFYETDDRSEALRSVVKQ